MTYKLTLLSFFKWYWNIAVLRTQAHWSSCKRSWPAPWWGGALRPN